jgi:hypothetical protein
MLGSTCITWSFVAGVSSVLLGGCASAPRVPESIVVAETTAAPPSAPAVCAPEATATPASVSKPEPIPTAHRDPPKNELALAIARIPPQEHRIVVSGIQALPVVDGRIRVQGRGQAFGSTGTATSAQLEVALPVTFDLSCENQLRNALKSGGSVDIVGEGTTQGTYVNGVGFFGLFDLSRVTACAASR